MAGKPLVLIVLDGFGMRKEKKGNAIARAKLKNFNKLWKEYPHTLLDAHGVSVGLPPGALGGSEVGHFHLGAGRIIPQELTVINNSIADGSFFKNPILMQAVKEAKINNKTLHVFGLLSDGGVHSHQNHLYALLKLCKQLNFTDVAVHAILDGRDTNPYSGHEYVKQLKHNMHMLKVGKLATVIGRAYAMDRANRWARVEDAYDLFVDAKGKIVADPVRSIQSHHKTVTDEFMPPMVVQKTPMQDGDVIVNFNFRADRAIELSTALTQKDFSDFKRKRVPKVHFYAFAPYSEDIRCPTAFKHPIIKNTLGEILSKHGMKQLRIAEKEKFAHVTFFFNGDSQVVFPKEARKLVPSVDVKTYDQSPAMSARKITYDVLQVADYYDFILVNFANPDMLGHTGKFSPAVKGLEVVDDCVGQIVRKIKLLGGTTVITADHGNADEMVDKEGHKLTSHSKSPVPFIIVSDKEDYDLKRGGLANVAPTILGLLEIKAPESYEESLIRYKEGKVSLKGKRHEEFNKFKIKSKSKLIGATFLTFGFLGALFYFSSLLFGDFGEIAFTDSMWFMLLVIFVIVAVISATLASLWKTRRASKSLAKKLKDEKIKI